MKRFINSSKSIICASITGLKQTNNINNFAFPNIIRNFSSSVSNFEPQAAATSTASETPRGRLLFITLVKSPFHQTEDIQESIKVLKLKKIHQLQVHKDTPQIRGLIYKCRFLLSVKSVSTAELFPEGTQHLPQHVRLTMKEKHELKLRAMREKKSMNKLIEEYTAEKTASQ